MKTTLYTLAATAILTVCACSSAKKDTAAFGAPEALKADSIAINEILQPRQWTTAAGKAVMISPESDSLFFVYNLPDFSFAYKCGTKGEGPNDFLPYVGFCHSNNGDTGTLLLSDYKNDGEMEYAVGEHSLYKKGSYPRHSDKLVFGADYLMPSCDFMVTLKVNKGDNSQYLYVRRMSDGSVVDSTKTLSIIDAQYDEDGKMYQSSSFLNATAFIRERKVALVYDLIDRVEYYEISTDGKITKSKIVGEELTESRLANIKSFKESKGGNQHGIVSGYATDKKIYAYYIDVDFIVKEPNTRPDIVFKARQVRVYDWDGNCLNLYDLEKDATSILVTADDKYLYTRSDMSDFDQVYRYTLK